MGNVGVVCVCGEGEELRKGGKEGGGGVGGRE